MKSTFTRERKQLNAKLIVQFSSAQLFRIFNKIYNLVGKQNTRFDLQMMTGILQNKLILIQEESPGSKTSKGDPLFCLVRYQKRV